MQRCTEPIGRDARSVASNSARRFWSRSAESRIGSTSTCRGLLVLLTSRATRRAAAARWASAWSALGRETFSRAATKHTLVVGEQEAPPVGARLRPCKGSVDLDPESRSSRPSGAESLRQGIVAAAIAAGRAAAPCQGEAERGHGDRASNLVTGFMNGSLSRRFRDGPPGQPRWTDATLPGPPRSSLQVKNILAESNRGRSADVMTYCQTLGRLSGAVRGEGRSP